MHPFTAIICRIGCILKEIAQLIAMERQQSILMKREAAN